eukprot:10511159-Heterocapsa_arctica.AAC.1
MDERQVKNTAAAWTTSLWFTNGSSRYDTLQKPIAKTVSKRLGIELAALRHTRLPDRGAIDDKPDIPTGIIRWTENIAIVSDRLMKAMQEAYRRTVLDTNVWNYAQTPEARAMKQRKQK